MSMDSYNNQPYPQQPQQFQQDRRRGEQRRNNDGCMDDVFEMLLSVSAYVVFVGVGAVSGFVFGRSWEAALIGGVVGGVICFVIRNWFVLLIQGLIRGCFGLLAGVIGLLGVVVGYFGLVVW